MPPVLDVHWCVGHQTLGPAYFRGLRVRREQIHIKTVGKLTIGRGTTVEDIDDTVDALWLLGRLDAPAEVRAVLLRRRRWKPSRQARHDWTVRVAHRQAIANQRTTDHSIGFVWFDRYELEKRIDLGETVDMRVRGAVMFASDVSTDLITRVFERLSVHGFVLGSRDVRGRVRQLHGRRG